MLTIIINTKIIYFRANEIEHSITQLSTPDLKTMMLDTESVNQTMEVVAALCKRIISRHQQRHCFACIKELPLLEGEHLCLAQSPSEVVDLFFEDSYNSVNNNLVNAIFVLDGDKPPAVSLDTIKEHFKEELKTKLGQHMEFVNNGELKVARAIVYLSPLFKSIA